MGKIWLDIARQLADSLVLPFNVNDYADMLKIYIEALDKQLNKDGIPQVYPNYQFYMDQLRGARDRFAAATKTIQEEIDTLNSGKAYIVQDKKGN